MARFTKIALVYFLAFLTVGLPVVLRVWLLPGWRDQPQPDKFSLLMLFEDTEYGPSFSEARFLTLKRGMSKREAVEALGEPLSIVRKSQDTVIEIREWKNSSWRTVYKVSPAKGNFKIDSETYYYSRAGSSSDHWYVRAVTFSSDGRIVGIRRIFYEG